MATLEVVRTVWAGWSGAPAYSIHYCTPGNAGDLQTKLANFFDDIKGLFNGSINWSWESAGNSISDADGKVNGSYSGLTPPSTVTATGGSSVYASALGAKVKWTTGAIVNHRRLKGATILVPVAASVFATDGTLDTSYRGTIAGAAAAFVGDVTSYARVFSRTHLTSSAITGYEVPDYGVVRRSRK